MPGYKSLDLAYTPAALTGGTCTPAPLVQSNNLTYASHDRICTPNTEPCTGNECTPSFGSSLTVCIAASGTMACPGAPFTHQHLVGGTASFTCSSTCGCSVTGACTGTLTLYTNNNCTGTTQTIPADGNCQDEASASSDTYGSYHYTAAPVQASCDPSGTSTAQNVVQQNPQTVCCTQ